MWIFIVENYAINVDNEDDANTLRAQGARELTSEEIVTAGMAGYEHLVGPDNTTVDESGKVTFAPPAPTSSESLFVILRTERDRRIAASDYLMLPDYPLDDETKAAVTAYRKALRDLPAQPGAPWDGGGPMTPWPTMPSTLNTANQSKVRSTYLPQ